MLTALTVLVVAGWGPDPLLPGTPWALAGHPDTLTAIAFAPDGKSLASAARDKQVKLWSLETGQAIASVKIGIEQPSALAFSPDSKRLAVGDVALSVQVLELPSGKVLEQIAHTDAVGEVSFFADGAAIAVAGLNDNGAVYELPGGKKRYEFRGRTARFSKDGKTLVISSGSGSISVLDGKSGKVKKTIALERELPLATVSADGRVLASWAPSGVDVKLWSPEGKSGGLLKGPTLELGTRRPLVTGVALTSDGKRAVVGGADGIVRLYTVGTAAPTQRWPSERNSGLALSADDTWLAVMDQGLIKLWKLAP